MKVTKEISKLENSAVKLTATIAKEDVVSGYNKNISKYAKNVQLPGFRKGHVPVKVLEQKYGDSLKQEVLADLIDESLNQIFAEEESKDIRPLPYTQPRLDGDKLPEFSTDKDLTFSVVYDVFPSVEVKDFSKIEVEKMISAKENLEKLDDVDLPSGIYFWRVGVESKNGEKIGFSDSRTLNILKKLSLPEVILPSQNSMSLTYAEKSSHFVWKNSDGADYYNIKITDKNGKIIAEKSGIKENSANFVLPPEKYNVSVQAFSEETVVSPMRASSVSNVSFALRNPVPVELIFPNSLEKIDGLSAIRMPTVFLWKNEIDIHAKSEFVLYRISSDGTEKKVYSVLNPKNEVKIERLTEGNYRWQILASTADGIPLDSSKNTFSVSKIPLLQNVTLLQPENNFVIGNSYLKNNRFITFSWKEISGATDYKFALYQKFADGSAKLIYSENTEKTEIQIKKQNFDIGDFEWSVSAFCHAKDGYEEQHSRVSTGIFKIRVELPGKIRLIKPGKMYAK